MTLPTSQNCDDVVITTASKNNASMSASANDNNTNTSSNSTMTAGEVGEMMDLMLTPSAADDNNNEINVTRIDAEETMRSNTQRNTRTASSFEKDTGHDDDSDMFGPPRSTPLLNSNRPRVPMISAKLRLREERKRILQLCANKLEKIKDSETNLRRSVCINNTYSRLTEEVRREKQSRYMANLPK